MSREQQAIVEETESETEEQDVDGSDEGELILEPGHNKVIIEKNDRSLSEFHRWYQNGRLIVDPDWQRHYVWNRRRASKLVESFLSDIPVPVVYLAKNEQGKYEVIDGLQRLTSVFDFFDNKYKLIGLELIPNFEGKAFRDLPTNIQDKLQDSTLRAFELAPQTPDDLRFVIFERLNTGGVKLNDMEIRNCLYRGKINNLIRKLSDDPDFKTAISQKNIERRMNDRGMVLRFLAFYERTYKKAKQGLKRFLNEFLETYRNANNEKLEEYERQFKKAMKASVTIFGDKGFRIRRDTSRIGSEWASRVNVSIFQAIAVSFSDYDLGQLTRRADAILEEYVDLVSSDNRWLEAVTASTGDYNKLEYVFETWTNRLRLAIDNEEPNDTQRLFSKSLKDEMYRQNPTCAICKQRIALILDAALDHDIHYWRGGKTVPENARLVHRQCNLQRPKK
jgi:hypothetical protein